MVSLQTIFNLNVCHEFGVTGEQSLHLENCRVYIIYILTSPSSGLTKSLSLRLHEMYHPQPPTPSTHFQSQISSRTLPLYSTCHRCHSNYSTFQILEINNFNISEGPWPHKKLKDISKYYEFFFHLLLETSAQHLICETFPIIRGT